jgi:hypothetical protein
MKQESGILRATDHRRPTILYQAERPSHPRVVKIGTWRPASTRDALHPQNTEPVLDLRRGASCCLTRFSV